MISYVSFSVHVELNYLQFLHDLFGWKMGQHWFTYLIYI